MLVRIRDQLLHTGKDVGHYGTFSNVWRQIGTELCKTLNHNYCQIKRLNKEFLNRKSNKATSSALITLPAYFLWGHNHLRCLTFCANRYFDWIVWGFLGKRITPPLTDTEQVSRSYLWLCEQPQLWLLLRNLSVNFGMLELNRSWLFLDPLLSATVVEKNISVCTTKWKS